MKRLHSMRFFFKFQFVSVFFWTLQMLLKMIFSLKIFSLPNLQIVQLFNTLVKQVVIFGLEKLKLISLK